MEKKVRIKIGNVVVEMPESVALQNSYYKALLQRGSKETPQIEVQTPFSDTEKEKTLGSEETFEQTSLRKTQRKGRRRKETGD